MIAVELSDGTDPVFLAKFYLHLRLPSVDINEVCRSLGVTPISSFLDRLNFDAVEPEEESTWFSAQDGAKTFIAIADFVASASLEIDDEERRLLIDEIESTCQLLSTAQRDGSKFHLIVVIMMPDTEE